MRLLIHRSQVQILPGAPVYVQFILRECAHGVASRFIPSLAATSLLRIDIVGDAA